MQLHWHKYKYFPYERDLAFREIASLLKPKDIREKDNIVSVDIPNDSDLVSRLVYFASASNSTGALTFTDQSILEKTNGNNGKRQNTRYSTHGLHEYKGKFNPQVAKAILNIFNAQPNQIALDPFCGSGTSLIECAHLGIKSIGTDSNPLAVFFGKC
jgi:adenine-specific DNA methylase